MVIIKLGSPTPPIPPAGRGQIALSCPQGAIHISPGQNIQTITNNNPEGTVFCLNPGVHSINYSVTPKNNNQYWGELGTIIDGTGWINGDETVGVFWCHNIGRVNVTVKNLVLRNLPQRGIGLFPWDTNTGWNIINCEIFNCGEGIVAGSNLNVSNNIIHHCRRTGHPSLTGSAYLIGGAYPNTVNNLLFDNNEIYECGAVQKTLDSTNVTWRNNYFHDNDGANIWSDGVGQNFLAEHNIITGGAVGVWYELCFDGIIRRNEIRNTSDQAVFISTSRNTEIYENTIQDCFRSIAYFVNCASINQFPWGTDARDNYAHHNQIRVPNTPGALANFFSYAGACDVSAYLNNSKNNDFDFNTYQVPDVNGFYFLWGAGSLDFPAWQALPQDLNGSISL